MHSLDCPGLLSLDRVVNDVSVVCIDAEASMGQMITHILDAVQDGSYSNVVQNSKCPVPETHRQLMTSGEWQASGAASLVEVKE